jgi:hypothetical protein
LASSVSAPLRVNIWPAAPSTTKKPSPWIATSVLRPVDWMAPWVNDCIVPTRRAPRPTCTALDPPAVSVGALAPCRVCVSTSEKMAVELLKPMVETLAMLFPTTSSMVWLLRMPERALDMERIMGVPLLVGRVKCRGSRLDQAGVAVEIDFTDARGMSVVPAFSTVVAPSKATPVTSADTVAPSFSR